MKYLAAIILFLIPSVALAQAFCGPRGDVVTLLAEEYGEHSLFVGITEGGPAVEIYGKPNGAWTALFTRPNGVSCVMAAGPKWAAEEPAKDDGEPVPFNDYEYRGQ